MYTMAMGASAAGSSAEQDNGKVFRDIKITEAIIEYNENLKAGKQRSGNTQVRPVGNGRNVHRSIALTEYDKIPFNKEETLTGEHVYIVEMSDKPAALYQGGIHGFASTIARNNQAPASITQSGSFGKLNADSHAVVSYTKFLKEKQSTVISNIQAIAGRQATPSANYTIAFNGFAVKLTQDQAARVAELPGVRQVLKDTIYELNTDVGPQHIGADKIWSASAGNGKFKGEGILVGVIDTGINTDHPSFAEVAGDGYVHKLPARFSGFLGNCEIAEFAHMCNNKLIGVRSYEVITDTYADPVFQPDEKSWLVEAKRPANGEDYNGHGSHTASTAAGNTLLNVDHVIPQLQEISDGLPTGLVFPSISGVAPRANIIMYQACHPSDNSYGDLNAGCPGSALLSSIEDAITDGVDVINYSIGSSVGGFPWENPIEMAFLAARESGVSVAASAGNSYSPRNPGTYRGAIDHLSPWLTSVAATTHGRKIQVEGKELNGFAGGEQLPEIIIGDGLTKGYSGPVVSAKEYGSEYEKCLEEFPAGFFDNDPEGVPYAKAPIVICKRGNAPIITKASNVDAGGAGGFILRNASSSESLITLSYPLPGIHISYGSYFGTSETNGYGLYDWMNEGSGHELTITDSIVVTEMGTSDYVADFSSRGPNRANPDVMSPNLGAPGVDVFAAWSDEQPFSAFSMPADYAAISGTSMAAPHVAGAMALLSQAHPTWSPAQIQSALMTTASLEGVTRARDARPYDPVPAGFSDTGSGVINVARATNAGLLLDETIDNYRGANPRNGGSVTTLNMPYLYNDNCAGTCTWMRTFTAEADGTWDVSAEASEILGAEMLVVDVSPKVFSLKAGQKQAIIVTATVLEMTAPAANSSQVQLQGRVDLVPQSESLPKQYLPLAVRYNDDKLPDRVIGEFHRDQGHTLTPMLSTKEVQSLNHEVFGLTKGERYDFKLQYANKRMYMGNDDHGPVTRAEIDADPGVEIIFFDVPEGTKRLIWKVQDVKEKHAWTSLDLGMDVNGDEDIQWSDEALCTSALDYKDFCAINNPVAGRYWAIAANWKFEREDLKNNADTISVSLGIVGSENQGSLTVEGPDSTDGLTPYQVKLNYNLDNPEEGEIYYGVVTLGTDQYNTSNLGKFAVELEHTGKDFKISASQSGAKEGDVVDYHVTLAPNLLAGERPFNLKTTLPTGVTLIEDSVLVGGIGNYQDGLTIEDSVINIDAVQPSSAEVPRHYVYTTNINDAQCRVPYGDDPTFYDLGLEGSNPIAISGAPNQTLTVPLAANGLPHAPLYGNPEKYAQDTLAISPFGYVQFDFMRDFFNWPRAFDDLFQAFPDTMVSPLWRGDVHMPDNTFFDFERLKFTNAVYAVVTDKHYIFQWDGGEEQMHFFSGNENPDPDAYFSVETFVSTELNFEDNDYEIVFAYGAIETQNNDIGSIGLHGYWGERNSNGPQLGYLNDGFAFNDVASKVSSGTVICADYRGPEQTQLDLKFSVRVSADIVGTDSVVTVDSQFSDSEIVSVTHTLSAPSNITLAGYENMTVAENSTIKGINVLYSDLKGTSNGIEVTGENISGMVSGTASGATFDLTPDADWHGETEVTVSVFDMAYPSDRASVSFMLTVESDGVEFGCTDSAATNFDANANTDDGSCTLPAPVVTPPKVEETSSGGSMGWLMLTLLPLAFRRRK